MDHSDVNPPAPPPPPDMPPSEASQPGRPQPGAPAPPGMPPKPPHGAGLHGGRKHGPRKHADQKQTVRTSHGFGRVVLAAVLAVGILAGIFALGMGSGVVFVGVLGLALSGVGTDQPVLWTTSREGSSDTVAIIPVTGVIDGYQAQFVRACASEILSNGSVDAVVLRVNSPGGGVTASDEIWYEVDQLRSAGLPVVASFGGVAASGGYYISCGCDEIIAQETCITGSIGVIAQILTFEGLLDKVGVEPVTLVARRSPEKNVANDIFREWTEEDRAQVLGMLDSAYDTFHGRVRDGRSAVIDSDDVHELASGSVYNARDALSHKLIDGIGYLDDAIARAEQLGGIATGTATVRRLYKRPSFLGVPLVSTRGESRRDLLDPETLRSFVNDLGSVRLMYLMHVR